MDNGTSRVGGCSHASGERNLSEVERVLSISAGTALALWGVKRITSFRGAFALGLAGALFQRGWSGECALYRKMGLDSDQVSDAISSAISAVTQEPDQDPVNQESEQSFPASDSPGWSTATASRSAG